MIKKFAVQILCFSLGFLALSWSLLGQASNPSVCSLCAPINAPTFTGGITVTGGQLTALDIQAGSPNFIYWNNRSVMQSPSNGIIYFSNLARTAFTSLNFATLTAASPEFLISGNTIGIRGGDGSLPAFASLPGCAAGTAGQMAWITDSTASTFGSTIAGSGANKVLAICDGTNWTVH